MRQAGYEKRAKKFIQQIYPIIRKHPTNLKKCKEAISQFNEEGHNVILMHGASRIALIYSDFVVKWDWNKGNVVWVGGCQEEVKNYIYAKKNGHGRCFAKAIEYKYGDIYFIIMPRATKIGRAREYKWKKHFTWISDNFWDLHNMNVGELNGYPVLVDYALRR